MIDTVRFRIPCNPEQVEKIKEFSNVLQKYNKDTGQVHFSIHNLLFEIPSHSYGINIFIDNHSHVYLELSVAKWAFSTNVYMCDVNDFEPILMSIFDAMVRKFGSFPPIYVWDIYRIDLCLSWKFKFLGQAEDCLEFIKTLSYPKKKKYLYADSVMYRGRKYTVKFYLKHEEFLKHDLTKLGRRYPEDVDRYIEDSRNILRYEVTFRREHLLRMFKDDIIPIQFITKRWAKATLQKHINVLFKYTNLEIMEKTQVYNLLRKNYSKGKASRLYNFYKQYYSSDEYERQLARDAFPYSTAWRYKTELLKVGVGVPAEFITEPELQSIRTTGKVHNPLQKLSIKSKLSRTLIKRFSYITA